MEFQELIDRRYSVRAFKDMPVEKEKLDAILEVARIAPTAGNRQPQRIMAVKDKENLLKIDLCTKSRYGAPLVLIICYEKDACWVRPVDGEHSGQVDASIITTYMMLRATELGLGSTWVLHFDPVKTKEEFLIPSNLTPVSLLILGYASDTATPSEKHSVRMKIDEMMI